MLPVIIGVSLAVVMGIFARITKFDRDRSFYAVVLIVIATYYVLFACMANEAIIEEVLAASVFLAIAVAGVYFRPLLLGVGIILHGVFDLFHGAIISNSGVPIWWPAFCASIDVVLGVWVIYLTRSQKRLISNPEDGL